VSIEIGDHLKLSGGKVTPVATSTDNLTFIGVAKDAHPSTGNNAVSGEITVSIPNMNAVYEIDLDAATDMTVGDNIAMKASSEQDGTKSDTDSIATCVESKLQATSIRCVYKLQNVTGGLRFIGDAS
jgi:hypothetical protein